MKNRIRDRTPSPEPSTEITPRKVKKLKKDKRYLHCPAPNCQLWRRNKHLETCKKYKDWMLRQELIPDSEEENEIEETCKGEGFGRSFINS